MALPNEPSKASPPQLPNFLMSCGAPSPAPILATMTWWRCSRTSYKSESLRRRKLRKSAGRGKPLSRWPWRSTPATSDGTSLRWRSAPCFPKSEESRETAAVRHGPSSLFSFKQNSPNPCTGSHTTEGSFTVRNPGKPPCMAVDLSSPVARLRYRSRREGSS